MTEAGLHRCRTDSKPNATVVGGGLRELDRHVAHGADQQLDAGPQRGDLRRLAEKPVPGNCRVPAGMGLPSGGPALAQPYVRAVKVAMALRLSRSDGWVLVTQRRSHRQFKHPSKPGRVTVAGRPSHGLAPGTLKSIMKQAGL